MDEAGSKLRVHLVGEIAHPDFREAVSLVRRESQAVGVESSPELIVLVESRPDVISVGEVDRLRRAAPLAGIVGLLGSWCEGETRTGRPWPGVQRLYSYEFVPWWRKQMQLRDARRCPDWARASNLGLRIANHGLPNSEPGRPRPRNGLIVLRTNRRDNADALTDVLCHAGFATAWQRHARSRTPIRGAIATIWDGGQLNDAEAAELEWFCAQMARNGAQVVAILDFPRRDRIDRAYEAGAAAVLGKPWFNEDVLSVVDTIATALPHRHAA